jgi:serine/threonine protein kinase
MSAPMTPPMTPEQWQQVKELFGTALDMDEKARAAFLDERCPSGSAIRTEIESLLAHAGVASFLDQPAIAHAPDVLDEVAPDRWLDQRIGPYRIVSLIGQGGMGDVYRAVRADDQFHKEVAIKVMRGGASASGMVRRFRAERQILASLDHPHIARLLDGGATDDGQPYLVMELVAGVPIDRYCTERNLELPARIDLFRMVCGAVQYAHQHLVIHRDLKPGNILVTSEGDVKLLDFGIAKLMDPPGAETAPDGTVTVMHVMTPDYCSPEQARGEAVTTASDIYSLGVVLYRLLTGANPNKPTRGSTSEWVRELSETEPAKPSAAAQLTTVPSGDDTTLGKWQKKLRGDLDSIVLTALRREPERRYPSADQLSQDLLRYLQGRPVLARGDQFSYSASRFIRRHKGRLAAAALLVLSLIGGIIATSREASIARAEQARAERHFASVRALANSFIFEVHDSIVTLPGSTPARQVLVKNAQTYLDALSKESGDDASLQRELASSYEKLADVQGAYNTANLGDTAGAIKSYREALAIRTKLHAREPNDAALTREFITNRGKLADLLYTTGDMQGALQETAALVTLAEDLVAVAPQDFANRRMLAAAKLELGTKRAANLDWRGGSAFMAEGRRLLLALVAEKPEDGRLRYLTALASNRLGEVMLGQAHDPAQARDLQKAGRVELEPAIERDPLNTLFAYLHAHIVADIGGAEAALGHGPEAVALGTLALAEMKKMSDADADNVQYRSAYGQMLGEVSEWTAASGKLQDAIAMAEHGLTLLNGTPDTGDSRRQSSIALNQFRIGSYQERIAQQSKGAPAVAACAQAKEQYANSVAGLREAVKHRLLYGDDVKKVDRAVAGPAC